MEDSGGGQHAGTFFDRLVWSAARAAVDAVRYQPRHLDLVLACSTGQRLASAPVARWWVDTRMRPGVLQASALPHALVRVVAARAAAWFGPTASALVRWFSGAVAATFDHAVAALIERPLRARAHPGLLVPHPHTIAVLAVDMRGFSMLTRVLHDTQYLTDLVAEYLTELTGVVEQHRGIVFQYTGDGLLALFLPELAGVGKAEMLDRLVSEVSPALHRRFDALYERWRAEWMAGGREGAEIGLGAGLSFGPATIGFLGPSGKKQFGVIGEPVNMAAFLCSEAEAGTVLIEREAFARAESEPPAVKTVRLRSNKPHQRVEAICLRLGSRRTLPPPFSWLAGRAGQPEETTPGGGGRLP